MSSDVNWDRVVSCVAGVEGLEVVERQSDGTIGATPRLLPGQPYTPGLPMPMTPEEFDNKYPPSAPLSCTDSALKTYRFVLQQPKILTKPGPFVRETNDLMAQKNSAFVSPPFKSCSDSDAWGLLSVQSPFGPNMIETCLILQRLDVKPGYASVWTQVGKICPGQAV